MAVNAKAEPRQAPGADKGPRRSAVRTRTIPTAGAIGSNERAFTVNTAAAGGNASLIASSE